MIRFGIVGSGWRAEFFLRIAKELSGVFAVSGVLIRDAEKGKAFEKKWEVPTFRNVDDLLTTKIDFVVLSVPRLVSPTLILEFTEKNMPVLAETPPAADGEALALLHTSLKKGAKVQVAEQYPFQPYLAACLQVVQSGKLGEVSHAQVSVAHDYHGMVLIRKFLGVGIEPVEIKAQRFESKVVAGPGRQGLPVEEKIQNTSQTLATLHFKNQNKVGVYDFSCELYFSWIRSKNILIRGDRGELHNEEVRFLKDFRTPVRQHFVRENAGEKGNLEGLHLKGIVFGEDWIYQNPFPVRLSDDEVAVATCLTKMATFVSGGESFYSLAEASYDHYLSLMISKAVETGELVKVEVPTWAR